MPNETMNGPSRPETILEQLDIGDEAKIADFGCGNGYFSIPLAKIARQGKVYAIDIIRETLEAVTSKATLEGIPNIETLRCDLEVSGGSKLSDESINLVLMRNILFQSQKKEGIIREAERILEGNGQLVLIEWIAGSSLAPKEGWLLSKDAARQLAENEGFIFEKELEIDNQHYGLVFKKIA